MSVNYTIWSVGFWMDIGQPKDFITGTSLYLDHVRKYSPHQLAEGVQFISPVLVVSYTSILELYMSLLYSVPLYLAQ